MNNEPTSYKEAIEDIEEIIRKIESGEPDVDELSDLVKKASALITFCKQKLRSTEEDLEQMLDNQEY